MTSAAITVYCTSCGRITTHHVADDNSVRCKDCDCCASAVQPQDKSDDSR